MKSLFLTNTWTNKKELFVPLDPHFVKVYSCGPTAYMEPHIGNWRTFHMEDTLVRLLEYVGYRVYYVMNITDIDDKTIQLAQGDNQALAEFTKPYIQYFQESMQTLQMRMPDAQPLATSYISEMIHWIETLLEKGFAYQDDEGNVYFSIKKISDYGLLSGNRWKEIEDQRGGEESSTQNDLSDEVQTKSDFVLWKKYVPERDKLVKYKASFGEGRPGWHLECSVMSFEHLGEEFDIHCGGVDNIFPHHENEIAQNKAMFSKTMARYFFHISHLKWKTEKMSKSQGNRVILEDLLKQGFSLAVIRYFLYTSHYRQELIFDIKGLENAQKAVWKIWNFLFAIESKPRKAMTGEQRKISIEAIRESFFESLLDDLNTPKAWGIFHKFINDYRKILAEQDSISEEEYLDIQDWVKAIDQVMPIFSLRTEEEKNFSLTPQQEELLAQREQYRKNQEYQKSDEIRNKLKEEGIFIQDTPEGTVWWIERIGNEKNK